MKETDGGLQRQPFQFVPNAKEGGLVLDLIIIEDPKSGFNVVIHSSGVMYFDDIDHISGIPPMHPSVMDSVLFYVELEKPVNNEAVVGAIKAAKVTNPKPLGVTQDATIAVEGMLPTEAEVDAFVEALVAIPPIQDDSS